MVLLRQQQFPAGCGKAYDVALLCKWLEARLRLVRDEQGHVSRMHKNRLVPRVLPMH